MRAIVLSRAEHGGADKGVVSAVRGACSGVKQRCASSELLHHLRNLRVGAAGVVYSRRLLFPCFPRKGGLGRSRGKQGRGADRRARASRRTHHLPPAPSRAFATQALR